MREPVEFDVSTYRNTLHICFTQSGAGLLRQALRAAGLEPMVIATSDNLSFGPINPPDSKSRTAWLQREFDKCDYADDWDWIVKENDDFWSIVSATKWEKRVVWFSRRTSYEYCGFLEWVRRSEGLDYSVVDVTDIITRSNSPDGQVRERLMESIAVTPPNQFRLGELLDNARSLTIEENARYLELWSELQAENSPFRIVGNFGIKSVPLNHFDHLLLSRAITDWRKSARIVGYAMSDSFDSGYYQVGDLALFGRLRALVNAGVLDARGDLTKMQLCEVRLKQP